MSLWLKYFRNGPRFSCILEQINLANSRLITQVRLTNTGPKQTTEDEPIQFSTSRAARWTARESRVGTKKEDEYPWFQTYSILISLSVFMFYFCVLREENDIDKELSHSLYDRIPGLEKKQLEISLEYNLEHNIDTKAIKQRLQEIDVESSSK